MKTMIKTTCILILIFSAFLGQAADFKVITLQDASVLEGNVAKEEILALIGRFVVTGATKDAILLRDPASPGIARIHAQITSGFVSPPERTLVEIHSAAPLVLTRVERGGDDRVTIYTRLDKPPTIIKTGYEFERSRQQ